MRAWQATLAVQEQDTRNHASIDYREFIIGDVMMDLWVVAVPHAFFLHLILSFYPFIEIDRFARHSVPQLK